MVSRTAGGGTFVGGNSPGFGSSNVGERTGGGDAKAFKSLPCLFPVDSNLLGAFVCFFTGMDASQSSNVSQSSCSFDAGGVVVGLMFRLGVTEPNPPVVFLKEVDVGTLDRAAPFPWSVGATGSEKFKSPSKSAIWERRPLVCNERQAVVSNYLPLQSLSVHLYCWQELTLTLRSPQSRHRQNRLLRQTKHSDPRTFSLAERGLSAMRFR